MKKLFSTALAVSLTASLMLSGCGGKPQAPAASDAKSTETKQAEAPKKVTLRVSWWGNQVRNERTQKAMAMYSEKNANVSFESEFVAWDGYWDKMATQAAANNLPDVIQQDYAYIGQYIAKKTLEDLNPYIKSGLLNTKDVSENVLSSGSMNGGLYAISLGTNAMCLILDPAAFKKAGVDMPKDTWTWKEYEETITKVAKGSGMQSEPLSITDPKNALLVLSRQEGTPIFSADGASLGLKDEKLIVELFDKSLNLTQAGVYVKPDALVSVKAVEDNPISKGTAFASLAWSNQFIAFSAAAKRPLEMVSMPVGGTKPGMFLKPSQFFSVSAKSANKNDAVKFIDYFINDIDANKVLLGERGVPISSKVRDGIKGSLDEQNKMIFDYIARIEKIAGPIDPPEPPGAAEVIAALKNAYNEVLFGKTKSQDAAKAFMKQANEILAKNKK